jgi:hypothetical protein
MTEWSLSPLTLSLFSQTPTAKKLAIAKHVYGATDSHTKIPLRQSRVLKAHRNSVFAVTP